MDLHYHHGEYSEHQTAHTSIRQRSLMFLSTMLWKSQFCSNSNLFKKHFDVTVYKVWSHTRALNLSVLPGCASTKPLGMPASVFCACPKPG